MFHLITVYVSIMVQFIIVTVLIADNGLHMACGGFEALSCPPKPKLATERKPYWQPFIRHKLYALLCHVFFILLFLSDKSV
jgi:hypothetical protein